MSDVEWRLTGRFTNAGFIEDDLLLEPTGRLVETAGVLVVAFEDDRVVWVHCFYDDLAVARAARGDLSTERVGRMNSAVDFAATGRPAGMGVLVATCVSTLIVNANTSAVTILLPAIAEDVNASISTLQWAVTGYSLVGAACIVTSGALGDVFGRRKVFIGGLLLFIASCVLIALSDSRTG